MSTRSTIALEFADGTVQQVYCHWDGYLSHNGRILRDSYSDPFKLQKLIDLGGMSVLAAEVEPTGAHCYENAQKGVCVFYGRDRGEVGNDKAVFRSLNEYYEEGNQEEYDYLLRNFNGTAVWTVRCDRTGDQWVTLEDAAKEFTE